MNTENPLLPKDSIKNRKICGWCKGSGWIIPRMTQCGPCGGMGSRTHQGKIYMVSNKPSLKIDRMLEHLVQSSEH